MNDNVRFYFKEKVQKVQDLCGDDLYFTPHKSDLNEVKKSLQTKEVKSLSFLAEKLNKLYQEIKKEKL
jgi:hypothetical protein